MADLDAVFDQAAAFRLAPIADWHPEKTVGIDIRIDANGNWLYQGSRIGRRRMVKLFSTVLRFEGQQYFLVTPPLKYQIQVDDAPFVAVELNRRNNQGQQRLYFRTNMDEVVVADEAHPLSIVTDALSGEPSPYIAVRDGLKAKITRSVFYQLVEFLQPAPHPHAGVNSVGVFSAGVFFPFGSI